MFVIAFEVLEAVPFEHFPLILVVVVVARVLLAAVDHVTLERLGLVLAHAQSPAQLVQRLAVLAHVVDELLLQFLRIAVNTTQHKTSRLDSERLER